MSASPCHCHDQCAGIAGIGNCTAAPSHSPLPWKIVRSEIPYYTWLMDATGGCVCIGFGYRDESLLLAAPRLLAACERALRHSGSATLSRILGEAIAAAKGE